MRWVNRTRIVRTRSIVVLLVPILAFQGCTDSDRSTQKPKTAPPAFTTPVVDLHAPGGKTLRFGIERCKVYRSVKAENTTSPWALLFQPAPYALPQSCVRERLAFDGEYVQIEIGTQAIGAGGCCTNYAAYRSRNGEDWEIRPATSITQWQKLDAKR